MGLDGVVVYMDGLVVSMNGLVVLMHVLVVSMIDGSFSGFISGKVVSVAVMGVRVLEEVVQLLGWMGKVVSWLEWWFWWLG